MIQEIKFSEEFQRAFKRLKKRYRSLPEDFKELMSALIDNPLQGSELYDGMRKCVSVLLRKVVGNVAAVVSLSV